MEELKECPNCGKKLKTTFSTIKISEPEISKTINEFTNNKSTQHCKSCQDELMTEAVQRMSKEYRKLQNFIQSNIHILPVLTTQFPYNWQYEVIDMVTGQSTTGTGVFAEFKSSFTDFFGKQSKTYNTKIKNGEDLCKAQLRIQALEIGANAVIGTDIDYSEVGGEKGMLMVCMAGTAVKVTNTEILGNRINILKDILNAQERMKYLSTIEVYQYGYL